MTANDMRDITSFDTTNLDKIKAREISVELGKDKDINTFFNINKGLEETLESTLDFSNLANEEIVFNLLRYQRFTRQLKGLYV
jgi:Sec7-like guanine-nucleotide exchange factor